MAKNSEEQPDDQAASPATADEEAESSPPTACLKCGRMVEEYGLCDACHSVRTRGPNSRVSLRSVRAQLANRCGTCGSLVGSGQGENACAVCETGLRVASPKAQEALAELELDWALHWALRLGQSRSWSEKMWAAESPLSATESEIWSAREWGVASGVALGVESGTDQGCFHRSATWRWCMPLNIMSWISYEVQRTHSPAQEPRHL